MDKKHIMRNAVASLMIVLGAGCSNQKQQVVRPDNSSIYSVEVIEYYVQPRDSLTRIAKKLTGDMNNWFEIGNFNGIYDPKNLQTGVAILVPAQMVTVNSHIYERSNLTIHLGQDSDPASPVTNTTVAQNKPEPVTRPATKPVQVASTDSSYAQGRRLTPVFQAESLPGAPQIRPATRQVDVNRTFKVTHFDATADNDPSVTKMVRVVGTYYPKGIYAEPEAGSRLLMRVAPGSTFVVQDNLGDWLQIKTETGSGFIRTIDARILGRNETSNPVLTTSL